MNRDISVIPVDWPLAAELRTRLAEIRDEVKATGRTPILQLETHGSPDGIALGGGDFVPWPVLGPGLTEINAATRLNLFALLSACNGRDLVQVVQPSEGKPISISKLIGAQSAWLAFREAHVKAHWPSEEPGMYGSVQPMCEMVEVTRLTKARIAELQAMTKRVEGDVRGCTWPD